MTPDHDEPTHRAASSWWRALCLASAAALALLGAAAYAAGVLPGDLELREEMVEGGSAALYQAALWANHAGSWRGLLPAFVIVLLVSRVARRHWWLWAAVLLSAPVGEFAVKTLVDRPRPNSDFPGFPSGHVAAITAFGVMVLYVAGRERLSRVGRLALVTFLAALTLLVSLARVYLYAHWPSDLLGGLLLGTACAAGGAWWHGALVPAGDRPARAIGATAAEGFR